MRFTAVVLAGSRPGVDPFAQSQGVELKALIPVGGVPMVRRPVEALLASHCVRQVRVLAQQPDRIAAVLPSDPRLSVEVSDSTIAASIERLCLDHSVEWPLLVTTADHALLDTRMVEDFCAAATGADIGIGLVERETLLAQFSESKRTWTRFKGGAFTGANLFALGSPKVLPAIELWRSVEQDRKKAWRLLAAFGPAVLLGALLRLRTIEQTLGRVGKKLGLNIRAIRLCDPLAAIDVDKPADLELVETILRERT